MATAVTIPRLGWSMDEGVFVGWLQRDGTTISAGDPLFSLEGEKATQDVEAIDGGTLRILDDGPCPGDTVPVGTTIGYLLQPGEPEPKGPPSPGASPRAVPEAVAVAPGAPSAPRPERPRSSPLARRLAREHGIDWTRLRGSGRSGRVRRVDVLEAARSSRPTARTPTAAHDGPAAPPRSAPVSPTRRAIAARMVESHLTTAPVTLTTTADATNLASLRRQFKVAAPEGADVPSYTDFLIKLAALALRDHPALHSRWGEGGPEKAPLVVPDEAHIGLAVDTEAGLVVPVIRGAAGLGIREVAASSRELVRRARERRLGADDVAGATFTVTNLGAFGVETFTPIINPPECAILGVGTLARRPVMDGDKVVGRECLSLSLTFDHRTVDGAPAARFLQHLSRMIENPGPWLMS